MESIIFVPYLYACTGLKLFPNFHSPSKASVLFGAWCLIILSALGFCFRWLCYSQPFCLDNFCNYFQRHRMLLLLLSISHQMYIQFIPVNICCHLSNYTNLFLSLSGQPMLYLIAYHWSQNIKRSLSIKCSTVKMETLDLPKGPVTYA